MKKYIFVTGGVCSSLGKGIAATSIGNLLESRGLQIRMVKIDPYINVDAGTMSPYQHGEVYVTNDGSETDLDLGNYARFTNAPLGQVNSITTGQVYQEVIKREREGRYLGRTVQVIPHITDEIKRRIFLAGHDPEVDVTIIEVGGTVGDIESFPFLEAARHLIQELGKEQVLFIHLTLLPEVAGGELKTKPTQHSVKELRAIGIQPDILVCRAPYALEQDIIRKISLFTNVEKRAVISAYDVKSTIYEIPLIFHEQKLDEIVLEKLNLQSSPAQLQQWSKMVDTIKNAEQEIKIGIVGKYIELHDSYKSIYEALCHGGIAHKTRIHLEKIDSEHLDTEEKLARQLDPLNALLIPGGFGQRGIEGMIQAAKYAREHKIPMFGICLGMQIMVIEYARHVLGYSDGDSTEFSPSTSHPVVSLLEEQIDVKMYGGTMRLGRSETVLQEETHIHRCYGAKVVHERHRHRYEVSNTFREELGQAGLVISGVTPEGALVESIEWPDHPWGVGVQFHPEFTSTPINPHPLFAGFVKAGLDFRNRNET
ncbi:MAG: CTP synthase [Spirochaetaceae bacterium]|nr:CTP synthase [Spirochaetaceae bacterium]MCF7949162.1 CTP synthase [Spirochaetia bacterium]MCF7951808.1 CTP synthase [Spirochaetaceae bacterium]